MARREKYCRLRGTGWRVGTERLNCCCWHTNKTEKEKRKALQTCGGAKVSKLRTLRANLSHCPVAHPRVTGQLVRGYGVTWITSVPMQVPERSLSLSCTDLQLHLISSDLSECTDEPRSTTVTGSSHHRNASPQQHAANRRRKTRVL